MCEYITHLSNVTFVTLQGCFLITVFSPGEISMNFQYDFFMNRIIKKLNISSAPTDDSQIFNSGEVGNIGRICCLVLDTWQI